MIKDIQTIHERLQWVYGVRTQYFKKNRAWFDACPDSFWGSRGNGYAQNKIRIASEDELPLMLHDPVYEPGKDLLEQRLKGTLKGAPYRQDLVDARKNLDIREGHLWAVLGYYEDLLVKYVRNKNISRPFDLSKLIILTIQGYTYYFLRDRDLRILSRSEVFQDSI